MLLGVASLGLIGFGQNRRVQERMIKEHPHCYRGADYDIMSGEDTTDKVHLSESGAKKAARLWVDAMDADFFSSAVPSPPISVSP